MIRRAIRESAPPAEQLLREEYNHEIARQNKAKRFRYAISNVPYYAADRVHQIRQAKILERICKRIFVRFQIPLDLFEPVDSYLDHFQYSYVLSPRLRNRGFSRAVHHLIHCDCLRMDCIDHAITLGKTFDNHIKRYTLIDIENEIHEFRQNIIHYVNQSGWNVISSWDINVIGRGKGNTFDHFSCWCV